MDIGLFQKCAVNEGNFLLYKLLDKIKFNEEMQAPAGTDGKYIFINEEEFSKQKKSDQYAILCHEALHIVYKHNAICDKKGLNPEIYNIACDIIINEKVREAGRTLKSGLTRALHLGDQVLIVPDNLKDSLSVYEYLIKNIPPKERPDEGSGCLQPDSGEESDADIENQAEIERSKDFSLEAQLTKREVCERELEKKLNIWDEIKQEIGRLTQPCYKRNFRRESRPIPGIIMPNYRGYQIVPKAKVFIDCSGSMGHLPQKIISNLMAVFAKGKMFNAKYYLFDTFIEEYDGTNLGRFGGGTDLCKVEKEMDDADLYVILTDCEGDMSGFDNTKKNTMIFTNDFDQKGKKIRIVDDEFENII